MDGVPDSGQDWIIEQLSADHDRSAFSCGQDSLDEFLRRFAGQNQKTGVSKTYVAIRADDKTVRGYYSIASGAVRFKDIPENLRKRLPQYPIPVAHIGRLAVDSSTQGQRLGELLLLDAFARIVGLADSIGIHAVEVVAIDESAKRFYLKYGFEPMLDDQHHLYISLKTLKKLDLI